jgi:hypothetical protein
MVVEGCIFHPRRQAVGKTYNLNREPKTNDHATTMLPLLANLLFCLIIFQK